MAQNCANMTRIYDVKHKSNKRTHEVQLQNKNADRCSRLTVLLKAASELKSTVAGKLFQTFTGASQDFKTTRCKLQWRLFAVSCPGRFCDVWSLGL